MLYHEKVNIMKTHTSQHVMHTLGSSFIRGRTQFHLFPQENEWKEKSISVEVVGVESHCAFELQVAKLHQKIYSTCHRNQSVGHLVWFSSGYRIKSICLLSIVR